MLKKTLSELSELNGGPGFEQDVSDYIIERMKSLGIDKYYLDVMGNLFVKIEGSDPHASIVLLDAHMDEPCFMVKYIDEKGYIYVTQTGLFSSNILFGQRVRIQTPYGNIKGCFGIKSYHISSSEGFIDPKLEDMWIDIGATCREDVSESGIKAGYPVIFDEPFVELANDYVMGKAFDNRVGCTALIGVMEDLVKE
ncbi:MAG: M42 family peptidase, partial [Clostridia bacterium]|nr:M42 family peptidase [Clostridia bacterium]